MYKKLILDLRTHRLKLKTWKMTFLANADQKRSGVAILTLDKIDIR